MEDNSIKIHRAINCVKKIKDEKKLAKIAREAPRHETRRAAVDRIADQNILTDLAKTCEIWAVRKEATEKITNQDVLSYLAINDKKFEVRMAAIERLTVQSVLAEVIKDDSDLDNENLRLQAVKNVTDQSILTEIAKTDENWRMKYRAAKRLTDQTFAQAVYADLVKTEDIGYSGRLKIVKRLTDQEALGYIVKLPNPLMSKKLIELRKAALDKITDEIVLSDILQNAAEESIRDTVAERLRTAMV